MAGMPVFGGDNRHDSLFKAGALTAHGIRHDFASESFVVQPVAGTLQAAGKAAGSATTQDAESGLLIPTCFVQNSRSEVGLLRAMRVRRITPIEGERLQGFPDNYTLVPYRGQALAPDGPRYKAIGNSMATYVMHWLGRRIELVLGQQLEAA